ncbi:MAG TPA: FAD-dependent oxidoreductase, partial [Candidatus Dormibacteraeota bacterium]|nr:FAD-dependent oxidoreductase [Candidatus Dormibacteraeota bacterium]
ALLPWRVRARAAAPRVVIVGGGFAGAGCALALRRLAPASSITLVDSGARYVTCPMSNAVIGQLRSLASITVSRAGLARAGVHFVQDTARDIDAQARTVRLMRGQPLSYDRLVVAPGIRLLYGRPAGYDRRAAAAMPHAWDGGPSTRLLAQRLKSVPDGGTVAISVPAGLMRCPPGPYERAGLIAHWLTRNRARCKVLIFDSNNHFPRQDVFTERWTELYPGMIEWIAPSAGGTVTRVDAAAGTLHSASGTHRVSLANIIPPQAPGLIAVRSGLAAGHGWCPVDPHSFESTQHRHVHVIGDACIAGAMPKSASAAHSQAMQCAAAIAAAFAGQSAPDHELSSVCYSLVSPDSALAMHGRFKVADAGIEEIKTGGADSNADTAAHVTEAQAWYQEIRAECFGS